MPPIKNRSRHFKISFNLFNVYHLDSIDKIRQCGILKLSYPFIEQEENDNKKKRPGV
nr:MAG TPA: hypothetical protein [Bacteriophage sp.]